MTKFVEEQYQHVLRREWDQLLVAEERVYEVNDREVAYQIKLIEDHGEES